MLFIGSSHFFRLNNIERNKGHAMLVEERMNVTHAKPTKRIRLDSIWRRRGCDSARMADIIPRGGNSYRVFRAARELDRKHDQDDESNLRSRQARSHSKQSESYYICAFPKDVFLFPILLLQFYPKYHFIIRND